MSHFLLGILDEERADDQLALRSISAAPDQGMRRLGEDRARNQVFPIAGEFVLTILAASAQPRRLGADGERVALANGGRMAKLHRLHTEIIMGPKQAEAGLVVIRNNMRLGDALDAGSDRDKIAFVNQIPDCQQQPFFDIRTAFLFRSKIRCGKCIFRCTCLQWNNGRQCLVQIIGQLRRIRARRICQRGMVSGKYRPVYGRLRC